MLSFNMTYEKNRKDITLIPLTTADREQFILDNQEAFNYGALDDLLPASKALRYRHLSYTLYHSVPKHLRDVI